RRLGLPRLEHELHGPLELDEAVMPRESKPLVAVLPHPADREPAAEGGGMLQATVEERRAETTPPPLRRDTDGDDGPARNAASRRAPADRQGARRARPAGKAARAPARGGRARTPPRPRLWGARRSRAPHRQRDRRRCGPRGSP